MRRKIQRNFWDQGTNDEDDQRSFQKFSILGFFWLGKFGKYFFAWVDLTRDSFGCSKQPEDSWQSPTVNTYIFQMRCSANEVHVQFFLEIFKAQRFHMGFFWGNILSRYFWVFLEAPGNFLGSDFCPHAIIPVL